MVLSEYDYLNRTLAIIDSCQVDCKIDFSFNLSKDFYNLTNSKNKKGLSISKHIDDKFQFHLTIENRESLLKDLSLNFLEGEICHYRFYKDGVKIGEGFDYCEINFLNPKYFKLTEQHRALLSETEIVFTTDFD